MQVIDNINIHYDFHIERRAETISKGSSGLVRRQLPHPDNMMEAIFRLFDTVDNISVSYPYDDKIAYFDFIDYKGNKVFISQTFLPDYLNKNYDNTNR